MNKDLKIDLVYLWVNGADENWAKRKAEELSKIKKSTLTKDAINKCRFQDNNELLYSIRSAEICAPWINHIYILTDEQNPDWLDINNPKITMVYHKDIMDSYARPSYNACAIETYLTKIPNLSEHFIFANDDMFFWKMVEPDFFFDEDGNPIYQMGKKLYNRNYIHHYGHMVSNAHKLIKEKFNKEVGFFPHHGIDPYRKSYIDECMDVFKERIEETRRNHFRQYDDLQRSVFNYYAIAVKNCKLKFAPKESYCSCRKNEIKKLKKSNFELACINSGRKTTDSDVAEMKRVLDNRFPFISSFENNKKVINVVFASDNNYAQHMAAGIASVLKNKNSNESIKIYIIDGGISEENKQKLAYFENNFECKIIFVKPNLKKLENCASYKGDYVTLATYYRLLIPELINEDKAIYLDCDIVVTSSLSSLYDMEFDNNLILGAIDVACVANKKRLELKKYINAGVLLMNLSQMRKENTIEKLLNWIAENKEKIELYDQDIINACLNDRISYVDKKYNVQVRRANFSAFDNMKNPVILHFISSKKPWTLWKPLSTTKYGKKYFEALKGTPWEEFILSYKLKTLFIAPYRVFYPSGFMKKVVEGIFSIKKSSDKKYKYITVCFVKFRTNNKKTVINSK